MGQEVFEMFLCNGEPLTSRHTRRESNGAVLGSLLLLVPLLLPSHQTPLDPLFTAGSSSALTRRSSDYLRPPDCLARSEEMGEMASWHSY